jgi:hypothetical protein
MSPSDVNPWAASLPQDEGLQEERLLSSYLVGLLRSQFRCRAVQ